MGASQSKSQKKEVICIDCDKTTQKDLPESDGLSSEGMPCEEIYKKVEQCMDEHQGQVAPCTEQWDNFKTCHSKHMREKGI